MARDISTVVGPDDGMPSHIVLPRYWPQTGSRFFAW
jgi:hypothetical protein